MKGDDNIDENCRVDHDIEEEDELGKAKLVVPEPISISLPNTGRAIIGIAVGLQSCKAQRPGNHASNVPVCLSNLIRTDPPAVFGRRQVVCVWRACVACVGIEARASNTSQH